MAKHRANAAISSAEFSLGQGQSQGKHLCTNEDIVAHPSLCLFSSQAPPPWGIVRELCFLACPLRLPVFSRLSHLFCPVWPTLFVLGVTEQNGVHNQEEEPDGVHLDQMMIIVWAMHDASGGFNFSWKFRVGPSLSHAVSMVFC